MLKTYFDECTNEKFQHEKGSLLKFLQTEERGKEELGTITIGWNSLLKNSLPYTCLTQTDHKTILYFCFIIDYHRNISPQSCYSRTKVAICREAFSAVLVSLVSTSHTFFGKSWLVPEKSIQVACCSFISRHLLGIEAECIPNCFRYESTPV